MIIDFISYFPILILILHLYAVCFNFLFVFLKGMAVGIGGGVVILVFAPIFNSSVIHRLWGSQTNLKETLLFHVKKNFQEESFIFAESS